jgi:hypothetical protein
MRGKTKLGILKLLTCCILPFCGFVGIFGSIIWILIDWVIALTKLGDYEKDFVFDYDGKWDKKYTKEAIEKEAKEKAERELREKAEAEEREKAEKERKEKYKKDILSGAISYDQALWEIEYDLSKYRSYLKEKKSELRSLCQSADTGSFDARTEAMAEILDMDLSRNGPPYVEDILSVLSKIKYDARIDTVKEEHSTLNKDYQTFIKGLKEIQSNLEILFNALLKSRY